MKTSEIRVSEIRRLLIGRTFKIVDLEDQTIYLEDEQGATHVIANEDGLGLIYRELGVVTDDHDCSSEIMECLALEYKELRKKMKE